MHEWIKEFPAAITVCDTAGIIVEMNDKAAKTFAADGGYSLIGHSLFDCHPPKAVAMIKEMLETGRNNTYTIEKNGIRKMIYQQPWFIDGKTAGIVEMSIEIPIQMPHYVRS